MLANEKMASELLPKNRKCTIASTLTTLSHFRGLL